MAQTSRLPGTSFAGSTLRPQKAKSLPTTRFACSTPKSSFAGCMEHAKRSRKITPACYRQRSSRRRLWTTTCRFRGEIMKYPDWKSPSHEPEGNRVYVTDEVPVELV